MEFFLACRLGILGRSLLLSVESFFCWRPDLQVITIAKVMGIGQTGEKEGRSLGKLEGI